MTVLCDIEKCPYFNQGFCTNTVLKISQGYCTHLIKPTWQEKVPKTHKEKLTIIDVEE